MADAAAEGFSLTNAFKKANHIRHWIMDISMALMAITAVVSVAGPMVGILDPIGPFIKMHFAGFSGIGDLFNYAPDAIHNLGNGVLFSDIPVDPTALHASHGMPDVGSHFEHALSPPPVEQITSDADYFGTTAEEYGKAWCPPAPGKS